MISFVQLVVQSKASDDYRGFVLFRARRDENYEDGLYEMRGTWAPDPVTAAQNAWTQYNDEWGRHYRSEGGGE